MKISYEGCIPEIAENLRKGQATPVMCRFVDLVKIGYIVGYAKFNQTDRSPYAFQAKDTKNCYWVSEDRIQIIKTETRVKSKAEILKILQDSGYRVDENGDWEKDGSLLFNHFMFECCGKIRDYTPWTWLPEWLEEVEVEEEAETPAGCKKEVRVKSKSAILEILQNEGYRVDIGGYWRKNGSPTFNPMMFEYCGKVPADEGTWFPEWLEEVEL